MNIYYCKHLTYFLLIYEKIKTKWSVEWIYTVFSLDKSWVSSYCQDKQIQEQIKAEKI